MSKLIHFFYIYLIIFLFLYFIISFSYPRALHLIQIVIIRYFKYRLTRREELTILLSINYSITSVIKKRGGEIQNDKSRFSCPSCKKS